MEGVNIFDGDLMEQIDVPDLNEPALSTVAIGRPNPSRLQRSSDPQSIHSILRTIGSLMASIATIVPLMLPLLDSFTSFVFYSRDNTDCNWLVNSCKNTDSYFST